MDLSRRRMLSISTAALAGTTLVRPVGAAFAAGPTGRDATQYGVKPDSPDDQTRALQRAIDETSRSGVPLFLPPGRYRTGMLSVARGTQLLGVRGATTLLLAGGPSLVESRGGDGITLAGITFDGARQPLPQRRGLVHLLGGRGLRLTDCTILGSGGSGLWLEGMAGDIRGNTFEDIAVSGIVSFDGRGLLLTGNVIHATNDNGIEILRTRKGDDGTIVVDNRIDAIRAGPGGSGQYGNAINAYRADNVIIRGNRINDCDFSGVRGNSASNIQIAGNLITNMREVAIYSEFSFEGAVITGNTVDGAAIGVSVCNFNEGGRLAVVQGNLIRNLLPQRPAGTDPGDAAGVGIYIEADTAVTGNVVENAPFAGIMAGWGRFMRDVTIQANVIRNAPIGIGVSIVTGGGAATISGNSISGTSRGAVIGLDHAKVATADLTRDGVAKPAQIVLGANTVR